MFCEHCINKGFCKSKKSDDELCVSFESETASDDDNIEEENEMDLTARRNERLEEEQQLLDSSDISNIMVSEYENLWGSQQKIQQISTDVIRMYRTPQGKSQPYYVNPKKVKALMISLQDNGMLQPLVVRELHDDEQYEYEVVVGNTRFAAASNLDWNSVPCIVQEMTDAQAYDKVCQSNIHRHYDTLAPSELANLYQGYLEHRGDSDETTQFIADRFNTSPRSIYRYVGLLRLPQTLIQAVDDGMLPFGKYERVYGVFTKEQQEVIGEWLQYYHKKLSRQRINALEEMKAADFIFSMDNISELEDEINRRLSETPKENSEEETSESETQRPSRLYATLRSIHSDVFGGLTDSELEEYIIRLVDANI